jgi:hypothetical protein
MAYFGDFHETLVPKSANLGSEQCLLVLNFLCTTFGDTRLEDQYSGVWYHAFQLWRSQIWGFASYILERSWTLGDLGASDSRRQGHGTVLYGKTNETLLRTRTYLGRDPVGPLAPLGGTEVPTPSTPHENGNVRVPNPKICY